MPRGLNKVMIIGSLGRDPEMRFTAEGRPVAIFNVATVRQQTGEGDQQIDWFHVVAWEDLAERCKKYLHENSQVYVEGRLQTRSWEGPNGQPHYRTELVAQDIIFLEENGDTYASDNYPETLMDYESDDSPLY